MQPIADLRVGALALAGHPDAGCRRLAARLARILAGDDPVATLGLKTGSRSRCPLTLDRLARRDDELRAWREHLYADENTIAAARRMIFARNRYRAAKLHEADSGQALMPESYVDSDREHLFNLGKIGVEVPGQRRLQSILATRRNAMSPP